MNDGQSASGVVAVPQFVDAPGVGLVGYHNHRGTLLLLQRAADHAEFIRGVDDWGIEDVDRFRGDTLAAKEFVVEISFTRIMNAHFGEPLRLCGGMREPNFTGVTVAIK